MEKNDIHYFVGEVLRKAVELEKTLPRIHIRISAEDFLNNNDSLWDKIRLEIVQRCPQYKKLLEESDLAFRVVYRPTDNNATLPGFDDRNINTYTLSLWYGMDYKPDQGEYVGMTPGKPWTYYMVPDTRYHEITQYHTIVYLYDNEDNKLVREGETTTVPLPKDNYLSDFLRMMIYIRWIKPTPGEKFESFVFLDSPENFDELIKKVLK